MRDLLFLAHRIPYPPDKGDKIRAFHALRRLSSQFRIHLGCFCDDAADRHYVEALREFCSEIVCLPIGPAAKILRASKALFSGRAISETRYEDAQMSAWVRHKLGPCQINDVFLFCSSMWPYVADVRPGGRILLDMVDVDSEKWGAYAETAQWPLRAIYRREQRKVLELESRAAMGCGSCMFVSKAEADAFLKLVPQAVDRVVHMDNGVDLERFDWTRLHPSPFVKGTAPIVFTGMMNYRPNVEAVIWFVRHALPAIRDMHKGAEFWIVGAEPGFSVARLASRPGVRVTGRVNDVRPYISNAACVVAPLRIARGVQNKVLEAMAMAKPVVLTSAALEGLSAIPDREILVADGAAEFVSRVGEVIGGKWPHLGVAARARVEVDHQWSRNLELLDRVFDAPACATASTIARDCEDSFVEVNP